MAGYIGTTPVPQATQHRESFTATGGQTSFATAGYTPQFIDVYLNGVKLAPADFTATNGSDVVLASGATASDILEIVAYTPFEVANQTFTGTTTAANLAVTGTFTSRGIDDNADAVAITIDSSENVGIGTSSPAQILHLASSAPDLRIEDTDGGYADINVAAGSIELRSDQGNTQANSTLKMFVDGSEAMRIDSSGNLLVGKTTTAFGTDGTHINSSGYLEVTNTSGELLYLNRLSNDGDLIRLFKDSAQVGSIKSADGVRLIVDSIADGKLSRNGTNVVTWTSDSFRPETDNAYNLGRAATRWKDLYLSGGVYLGGTGSANKLDDYEEGTWTPTFSSGTAATIGQATYTKIGRSVTLCVENLKPSDTTSGNTVEIQSLPFAPASGVGGSMGSIMAKYRDDDVGISCYIPNNVSHIRIYETSVTGDFSSLSHAGMFNNSAGSMYFTITYFTT